MADVEDVKKSLKKTIKKIEDALKADDDASDEEKMDSDARSELEEVKEKTQELLDQILESGEANPKDPMFIEIGTILAKALGKIGGKVPRIGKILSIYMKLFGAFVYVGALSKYPDYEKARESGFEPGDPYFKVISHDKIVLTWYEMRYMLRKHKKAVEEEKEKAKRSSETKEIKSALYIESIEVNINIF